MAALRRALERARRARPAGARLVAGPQWPLLSALVLSLAGLVETIVVNGSPSTSDGSTALLLTLLATVPLGLRRERLPLAAVIVTLATVLLMGAGLRPTMTGITAQLWVLYLMAARYPRKLSLPLVLPFVVNALSPFGGEAAATRAVVLLVLAAAALAVGDARRLRGTAIAERDQSRRAMVAAQRDQAAMAERARIARELHDVVAHHVSMIAIQADTARLATPGMPDLGRERLEAIGATARDTMSELRGLLGALRSDAGEGGGDTGDGDHGDPTASSRAPQPGLNRLDELVGGARAAGTPVRVVLGGRVEPLAPGLDLAAYRIVQEALTNARRHAPGAEVEVELRYTAAALRLRISDSGAGTTTPASPPAPAGHGLVGMRERVAIVGGSLRTGTAEGGGFLVEAELPLQRPAP
jgi:signal transduction histidine kinase